MTRRPTLWIALALLLVSPLGTQAAPETYERWYALLINDERAGWMHERASLDDEGRLVTVSEMSMSIDRMGQTVELEMGTRFVETLDGEPVSMRSEQDFGMMAIETAYDFDGARVRVTTTQGGRTTTSEEATPAGSWLTPGEARTLVEKRLEAGAERIAYATIDPFTGLTPYTVTQRVIGATKVEVLGKTVPAIEWEIEQSIMPGMTSRQFVDEKGLPLRLTIPMGVMNIEMVAAEKAIAQADFDAPELMGSSLIRVPERIEGARSSRRGVFVLRSTTGVMPDLVDAGVQRIERIAEDAIRVTVHLDDNRPADADDNLRREALGSSVYIDPSDGLIAGLTDRALEDAGLGNDAPPLARARALERFVETYIEDKMLGVGFATASEVCLTREGDCSEHAMLLAAMLRANGIPARTASGLVYADGFAGEERIFGYHMWTQALIELDGAERWVDLDAAIRPMDATHILISTSTHADGDPVSGMIEIVGVFGALEIDVESVE